MVRNLVFLSILFLSSLAWCGSLPIEQVNPQTWKVHADAFSQKDESAQALLGKDVVEASFLEEEESQDIKMIKIHQGSLLQQAGFQMGDRVVGVNGEALDGAWSTLTLLKELKNSNSSVTIQVARQGKITSRQYLFEGDSLQDLSMIFIRELTDYLNPLS